MLDLDGLRSMLGFGPVEGEAWFCQTEQVIGFAVQKSGMRAVILREWGTGPIAKVFARTTASQQRPELVNPGHTHQATFPDCWLTRDASIVLSMPLPLDKAHLKQENRLCSEDDSSTVAAVMAAPC